MDGLAKASIPAGQNTIKINKPHGLSAISHNKRYLPSSLRLPRVPLGGSATSRTPLAAVAARGAEDSINDDVENVDKVLLVSGIFRENCCLGATLL